MPRPACRAGLALLAWLCLAAAGSAQTLTPAVPGAAGPSAAALSAAPSSAQPAAALTFPALTGRVVDQAGLLSAADQASLTQSLAALEARTSDQVVVVTVPSLQGRAIEEYGYQLGRSWGIGQKGHDNGALLIVAAAEHQVRIEVGYGLEGTLTDAATKVIIDTAILPRLRAGDTAGGIIAGTGAIIRTLDGDDSAAAAPAPLPDASAGQTPPIHIPVLGGILLALGAVALLILCAVTPLGIVCRAIMQVFFVMALSGGRGGGGRGGGGFSGGGGSFGGGGSSGSW